jgi:hypothetical protein
MNIYINLSNSKLQMLVYKLQKALPELKFTIKPINQINNERGIRKNRPVASSNPV